MDDAALYDHVKDAALNSLDCAAHISGCAHVQTGRDCLVDFAVPDLWFRLTLGYAALCGGARAIGAAGFDGVHTYRSGFHYI